jgi:deoxyguanosine kinase
MIVQIEGNIGAGKTTLARNLSKAVDGLCIEELFVPAWLDAFYNNPEGMTLAFQTKMAALVGPARAVSMINSADFASTEYAITDRGLFGNLVFAATALRSKYMSNAQFKLHLGFMEFIKSDSMLPDVVIYLRAPPEACLARIQQRGRTEEKSVELSYLQTLHEVHETYLGAWKAGLLDNVLGPAPRIIELDWAEFGDVAALVDQITKGTVVD